MRKINLLLSTFLLLSPTASIYASDVYVQNQGVAQIVTSEQAQIGAPMNGHLDSFPFKDGDSFKKGDVLAHYHCSLPNAQLEKAHASHIKASSILNLESHLKEYSKADVISFKADLDVAKADEDAAEATISDCSVIAPYNGIVGSTSVHNYQFTQLGSPLLEIYGKDNMEVSILFKTNQINDIKINSKFNFHIAETGKNYIGHFTRISGKFDPISQTVRVYGTLDNISPELHLGMTGVITKL